jgi:hypothetical protein
MERGVSYLERMRNAPQQTPRTPTAPATTEEEPEEEN